MIYRYEGVPYIQVTLTAGFKVKKGNLEVDYGAKLPTFNTPPQSPCSPIKEQERQATMPSGHSKGKSREDLGRGQVKLGKIKSRKTIYT